MSRSPLFTLFTAFCACQSVTMRPSPDPTPPVSSVEARPSPPADEPPAARAVPSSAWSSVPLSVRPSEEELRAALGPMQVTHGAPARRVLYTWTTRDQSEALRRERRLLTKGALDDSISIYEASLWRAYSEDPLARVLFNPPFLMHRYAWPHAWATRLGGDTKSYGDELLRVTLKEDALVVAFLPHLSGKERWAIFDLQGRAVPQEEALKKAGKIAAVYHVHRAVNLEPSFREYVLCNEAMIESWALATEDIKATLRRESEALSIWRRALPDGSDERRSPEELQHWMQEVPAASWASPRRGIPSVYEAALAFANERYEPRRMIADDLLSSLSGLKIEGEPLEHRPGLPEPKVARVAPPLPKLPPRKVCYQGTFTRFECYDQERNATPCRDTKGWILSCP